MYWHIETDIISLIATGALLFYSLTEFRSDNRQDRLFNYCLVAAIIMLLTDIGGSLVFDYEVSNVVFHIAETAYFASVALTMITWTLYVIAVVYSDWKDLIKTLSVLFMIPAIMYVIFVFSNLWTGWLYTLTPDGEYTRGDLFFVPVLIFVIYSVSVFLLSLISMKYGKDRKTSLLLTIIPIMMGFGLYIQLTNEGWLTMIPSYVNGLLVAFIFIQKQHISSEISSLKSTASTDGLTGVYNKRSAVPMISEFLADKEEKGCVLLIADLDKFKEINDKFGHAVGDLTLKAFADMLIGLFRSGDIICRYGGDEFMVFLPEMLSRANLVRRLSVMVQKTGEITIPNCPDLHVTTSIGAFQGFNTGETFETMFAKADSALYYTKSHGRDDFTLYSAEIGDVKANSPKRQNIAERQHHEFSQEDTRNILISIQSMYSDIVTVNLKDGSYHTSVSDGRIPSEGYYPHMIDAYTEYVHPDDREVFIAACDLESLRLEARTDRKLNEIDVRSQREDQGYKTMRIITVYVGSEQDSEDDFVQGFIRFT